MSIDSRASLAHYLPQIGKLGKRFDTQPTRHTFRDALSKVKIQQIFDGSILGRLQGETGITPTSMYLLLEKFGFNLKNTPDKLSSLFITYHPVIAGFLAFQSDNGNIEQATASLAVEQDTNGLTHLLIAGIKDRRVSSAKYTKTPDSKDYSLDLIGVGLTTEEAATLPEIQSQIFPSTVAYKKPSRLLTGLVSQTMIDKTCNQQLLVTYGYEVNGLGKRLSQRLDQDSVVISYKNGGNKSELARIPNKIVPKYSSGIGF